MVHDPIPSPVAARRYRRQFKQQLRRARQHRAELQRQWALQADQMPGLAIASGRPRVPVSGLVVYVLTTAVARALKHAQDWIDPADREQHFARAGEFVRAIYLAGKRAPDFERRGLDRTIAAYLLDVQRKLVDLRLQPERLRAELRTAGKCGYPPWVHVDWIKRCSAYREDGLFRGSH